jgi:hypothetical protein
MIKSRGPSGRASVTFTLSTAVGASQVAVCGEWNNWSPESDIMERTEDAFTHTVELEAGRTFRFRYLLDGHRWENDWAADLYVPNDHGGDDSVVDLTALMDVVPIAWIEEGDDVPAEPPVVTAEPPVEAAQTAAAAPEPPPTKGVAKKAAAAKKTVTKKAAPAKAASAATKVTAAKKSQSPTDPAPARRTTKKSS